LGLKIEARAVLEEGESGAGALSEAPAAVPGDAGRDLGPPEAHKDQAA